jgi:hypothetical protein
LNFNSTKFENIEERCNDMGRIRNKSRERKIKEVMPRGMRFYHSNNSLFSRDKEFKEIDGG